MLPQLTIITLILSELKPIEPDVPGRIGSVLCGFRLSADMARRDRVISI